MHLADPSLGTLDPRRAWRPLTGWRGWRYVLWVTTRRGDPDSARPGGYLARMRRTLGAQLMERGLTHLPGNLRLLVLALAVLSVATVLPLALALVVGGDYTGPNFAIVRTALSVVIIAGAGLGVAHGRSYSWP